MNQWKRSLSLTILILLCKIAFAGGEHHAETETHLKGIHGGRLLSEHNLSVEVVMTEQAKHVTVKLYLYQDAQLVSPKDVQFIMTLTRLGEPQQTVNFTRQGDAWLNQSPILTPHSYKVALDLSYQQQHYHFEFDAFEGRTTISDEMIRQIDLATLTAGTAEIIQKETLFGVIAPLQQRMFNAYAPYSSVVKKVHVQLGDQVVSGQVLLTLVNPETLQTYTITSQIAGEVTQVATIAGEKVNDQLLLQVIDLAEVWVELSAFPEAIERLQKGQTVSVYDLHQHEKAMASLIYIAPVMTEGHIARARALLPNPNGHWRVGMHIKADVSVKTEQVPLAVKRSAIQQLNDHAVVFLRFGNTFEARPITTINSDVDTDYVEVSEGINPGQPYVSDQSYWLKADILKQGASHAH